MGCFTIQSFEKVDCIAKLEGQSFFMSLNVQVFRNPGTAPVFTVFKVFLYLLALKLKKNKLRTKSRRDAWMARREKQAYLGAGKE